MDLDGNPTSAMGHYMYKLACNEEIKHTKSGREFVRRIKKNREYSDAFLENYHDYMDLYGCRGFKEIDIASPRAYEDLEAFFLNSLKQLIQSRISSYMLRKGVEKLINNY